MRKNSRNYIRYLRAVLGTAVRTAYDELELIMLSLERGYRWEQNELVHAVEVRDDTAAAANAVGVQLQRFLKKGASRRVEVPDADRPGKMKAVTVQPSKLTVSDRRRLDQALDEIARALKLMKSIDPGGRLHKLSIAEPYLPVKRGHEAYYLYGMQRAGVTVEGGMMTALMRLRSAWSSMFYATQAPSTKRMQLTERETIAYLDPMTTVEETTNAQASAYAADNAKYVEVISYDGEILFAAQPPTATKIVEATMASKRARGQAAHAVVGATSLAGYKRSRRAPSVPVALGDATEEEMARVTAILVERPGIRLAEAAAIAGLDVVPVIPSSATMTPNAGVTESELVADYYDHELFGDLWSLSRLSRVAA